MVYYVKTIRVMTTLPKGLIGPIEDAKATHLLTCLKDVTNCTRFFPHLKLNNSAGIGLIIWNNAINNSSGTHYTTANVLRFASLRLFISRNI